MSDAKARELLELAANLAQGHIDLLTKRFGSTTASMSQDATMRNDIRAYLATPPDDGWISVEDRLPVDHEEVIAWDGGVAIGRRSTYYDGEISWFGESDYLSDVTHWQPLPDPPKEQDDEGE